MPAEALARHYQRNPEGTHPMSRNLKLSLVGLFAFLTCSQGQGLKPVPANEYNAVQRYSPTLARALVTTEVGGQDYTEVQIVEGPLPPLPPSVDLTKYAPKPGRQDYRDCTAWATAYCSLSIQNARLRNLNTPSKAIDLFSPRFTYSQINGGSNFGSFIYRQNSGPNDSAVGLFQSKGCSSELMTPYINSSTNQSGWSVMPDTSAFVEASNYVMFQYNRCETIDDIRYALVFGIPIVIGAYTEPSFYSHSGSGNYVWSGGKNDRHAMCIIGYDNAKQAFRVQNSWGESWGDQGRFWVGFNEFAKLNTSSRDDGWCYEAHAIILNFNMGTQLRSTLTPPGSFFFTPDGGVELKSNGVKIANAGSFRSVESTNFYLYGLRPTGELEVYQNNQWNEIYSAPFPAGLGGGKVKVMGASGKFLYVITMQGNICGRVPGSQSATGSPFWEKINLPGNKTPVDLRFRNNAIFVEASDGTIYKRVPGTGWQQQP